MFYLRAVANHSAFIPGRFDAAKVVAALADRKGGLLSVFRVADAIESERIATLYAMGFMDSPGSVDYAMIPESWLDDAGVTAAPDPRTFPHPLLIASHHELHGLDVAGTREALAERFHLSTQSLCDRISKQRLVAAATREVEHADTGPAARALIDSKPAWQSRLPAPGK